MDGQKTSRPYKKLVGLALSLLLLGAGFWALQNKWQIRDTIASRGYKATQDSEEVRANLKLTNRGDLVYRASLTEVDSKENFKLRCPVNKFESASVLGCYANQRIYVLKVDEPKLQGVEEVTATHELLHAQWERMSSSRKKEVEGLIEALRPNIKDAETLDLVKSYQANIGTGEELYNEMFAIFGTQLNEVGAELEEVYSEYLTNRGEITKLYKSYNAEFKRIEDQLAKYDSRLGRLKSEKEALEAELNSLSAVLEAEKSQLNSLENSGAFEEYTTMATTYNQKVQNYNNKVERIRAVIDEYNGLVEERNALAVSAKDLQDQLNANVSER